MAAIAARQSGMPMPSPTLRPVSVLEIEAEGDGMDCSDVGRGVGGAEVVAAAAAPFVEDVVVVIAAVSMSSAVSVLDVVEVVVVWFVVVAGPNDQTTYDVVAVDGPLVPPQFRARVPVLLESQAEEFVSEGRPFAMV